MHLRTVVWRLNRRHYSQESRVVRAKALLLVLLATALTSCGSSPAPPTASEPPQPGGAVGDVVSAVPLLDPNPAIADAAASARLLTYVSLNAIYLSPKTVTASVYMPKGQPPQDGFPVVALGRPVTGTGQGCASSSTQGSDDSPTIVALLNAGYVVVVPDYLGLSQAADNDSNYHPYLDSATLAQNMTDAVWATHSAEPQASTSWVAMGTGQGGQAAWAANEIGDYYGSGLSLRGAIGSAPTADMEGLADAAASGTLTQEQKLAYIAYVNALDKEYPDDFRIDDYRRGTAAQHWDLLLGCSNDQAAPRADVLGQITPDDLSPASPEALATLHGYMQKTNLPQAPAKAPMLIEYGTQDPLTPAAWTELALDRACGMGDVISIQEQPVDSPAGIDASSTLGWIADRFAGNPAPNDCPEVVAAHPVPVSAPIAAPPPPPQLASTVVKETDVRNAGVSLVGGWLPVTIQAVALAMLLAAIGWRSRRWRLRWLPVSGAIGIAIAVVTYWYIAYQGWAHDPPLEMWAWIAATGFACAVAVLGWPTARWGRRIVSLLAVPLAVIGVVTSLNVSLRYLPTVPAAWDFVTGAQPPDLIDEEQLAAMVHDGVRPTKGTLVMVTTPDDQSGFKHRQELVYLPPAWFESSPPPPLPVVMMFGAGMGHPGDWIYPGGGDALHSLDAFALSHRGVAPIAVFADLWGAFANDTECVNGPRGNAADHLTKDVVPYMVSHFGASADPARWAMAGWSSGGTCALTLAVMHPELFSAFVDLDGDLGPNAGSKDQSVARLFGGDVDAWAAFDPKSVVEARGQYRGMSAWIGVSEPTSTVYRRGRTDSSGGAPTDDWDTSSEDYASTANRLCELLSGHGIECAVTSYSGAHDFSSAANGFAEALPWLVGKLGAAGVARQPMPGAPPAELEDHD
jgi:S-formylglutathione hydrolase FrmB